MLRAHMSVYNTNQSFRVQVNLALTLVNKAFAAGTQERAHHTIPDRVTQNERGDVTTTSEVIFVSAAVLACRIEGPRYRL
jgi:hypothetical protein